jgi:serine/threonine protein kinase
MLDRSSPLWTDSPMARVFISHATEDREFVEKEIISLLQRHGIQTWYSKDDIHTAVRWEQTIRLGLESCDWFLVVLTPRSVTSTWVQAEVHWALDERHNRFVPVLAEDCEWRKIHLMMRTIQFVDFRQVRGEAQRRLLECWNISPVSPERDRKVELNAPQELLGRLEGESLADWVARLREDMQVRAQTGPVPRVEVYLRAFPDLASDVESILELISTERLLRREAGDDAPTGFYTERFPDQREEIEEQFAFDVALDEQAAEDAALDDGGIGEIAPVVPGLSSPAIPTPPRLPARYRSVRLLGQGGFADVWLCRDTQLGPRPVAIKILRQAVGGGRISARFRREAAMAAQVRHPNVCVIHDSELDQDPPYLVLEYVDGNTLRELLTAGSPLEIDEAVRIAREVADGCHACHEQGIVHRDLKPENIKRDSRGHIKILDFGLARPFDPDQRPVTSDGRIVGTIDYLSPEQTQAGRVPIGAPSDQFSLGVILYEMLTGRRPFSDNDDPKGVATLIRINECRPRSPRASRPDVDEALASIVLRMLQRDPGDRFGSMLEVVATLDSNRAGNRLPVPLPHRGRWTRRAAICVVVVVVLAGTAGVGRLFWPETPAPSIGLQVSQNSGATSVLPPVSRFPKNWSFADLMTLIREDLDRQVTGADQPFQRYFTLTNLANDPAVSPQILQRYRDALTQLLPALSIREPTAPKPIDAEQLVFRVDTRALGWTEATFRREFHRHNPYALQFPTACTEDQLRNVAHDVERRLGEFDDNYPAFARVDWIVATFSDPQRARSLLKLTHASPEEIEERSQRIASLRTQWADLLALYDRPLDLAAVGRELGVADEQRIRQAILLLPDWGGEKLGLRPLTEGKKVNRAIWSYSDVAYTTYGQVCQQLKLGRRMRVRRQAHRSRSDDALGQPEPLGQFLERRGEVLVGLPP